MSLIKCLIAYLIARSSRKYVEYRCCAGANVFDHMDNGLQAPSTHWSSVAPRQVLDASVERARGAEGTGWLRDMAFKRRVLESW